MGELGRKERMFLQFLGETGRVKHAWRLAGGDPENITHLYRLKRTDADFKLAWEEAMAQAADSFEDEAARRAVEGVKKDVYYKGEVVGQEVQYSDGLLAKMLDGAKPEKYAPKKDSTNVHVQVGLAVIPMIAPTMEDWERGVLQHQQSQPPLIEGKAKELLPPPAVVSKKVVVV